MCRHFGIRVADTYSSINDQELDTLVRAEVNNNMRIGPDGILARLRGQGHVVQRQRIRASLSRIHPGGAAIRAAPPTQRRTYSIAGPNSMWHIDGNHKLIR